MQNSMVMSTFSVFNQKHLFCVNFFQKLKIVSSDWNLVPRLIRVCQTQRWCLLFSNENILFLANFLQKLKFSVQAQIYCLDYFEFVEFNGDVYFFCSKIPFLDKFGLKIQNCFLQLNLVLWLIRICRSQW